MENTTEIEVGPYRVVSNGRTVATAATRRMAELKAGRVLGATVQGRRVLVATFGGN